MLGWFRSRQTTQKISKPIVFSMGEPAGIGSECLLKTWALRGGLPPFFVVGDAAHYKEQAKNLRLSVPIQEIKTPEEASAVFTEALPVLHMPLNDAVKAGTPAPSNAAVVLESIKVATQTVLDGKAQALVTLPIHKSTLYHSGFQFAGHTEFLTSLCNTNKPTVMMLEVQGLRVALSTVHVSLKDAIEKITTSLIVNNGLTVERSLRNMFGISKPRLAVAALNPHAGEQGALGLEEIEIIEPAIEQLKSRGLHVTGPHPADTLFHARMRETYDCALCLYHDQGLIPIKTLDFYGGVNITLGLPIVRTSPDHGTAFDIAGKGLANPESTIAALKRAHELTQNMAQPRNNAA